MNFWISLRTANRQTAQARAGLLYARVQEVFEDEYYVFVIPVLGHLRFEFFALESCIRVPHGVE